MPRREFSRTQRREIRDRAGDRCEKCGAILKLREGEYDHRIPQAQGGDNSVENGQLLCRTCHGDKTGRDKADTEKCKRIRDKHLGIFPRPTGNARLRSRPFPKTRTGQ